MNGALVKRGEAWTRVEYITFEEWNKMSHQEQHLATRYCYLVDAGYEFASHHFFGNSNGPIIDRMKRQYSAVRGRAHNIPDGYINFEVMFCQNCGRLGISDDFPRLNHRYKCPVCESADIRVTIPGVFIKTTNCIPTLGAGSKT